MNICPLAVELFHADREMDTPTDGQTDVTKLIVSIRNFGSAPKIVGSHKN